MLDRAVEVAFDSEASADEWLDSPARTELLRQAEALGHRRTSTDLVLADGDSPAPGVAVFMHNVASGRDAEFIAAQAELTANIAAFPGYALLQWFLASLFRFGVGSTPWTVPRRESRWPEPPPSSSATRCCW